MLSLLVAWTGGLPEVEHCAPEVADMLRIHLAEVAEVVLAHKVRGSLLHGLNVQLAMLQDVVLVLPPPRAEPALEACIGHVTRSRNALPGAAEL